MTSKEKMVLVEVPEGLAEAVRKYVARVEAAVPDVRGGRAVDYALLGEAVVATAMACGAVDEQQRPRCGHVRGAMAGDVEGRRVSARELESRALDRGRRLQSQGVGVHNPTL
jgi:hypothetical protein